MLLFSSRLARRLRSYRRVVVVGLLLVFTLDAVVQLHGRPPALLPDKYAHPHLVSSNTTVYIASVHRNTEPILKAAWSQAVLDLATYLGPENIYFSAIEGGSQDDTKGALQALKQRLDEVGVGNTVILGQTVWEQLAEIEDRPQQRKKGWIWDKANREFSMRRIPYLANVRNNALEPLEALALSGRRFSKILWLNDVVFDTEDVVNLLNTRDGRYAAACSMDFKSYPYYYDTFALRDEQGQKTASLFWPWFLSPAARRAVEDGRPVSVFSCWNGITVFDASPFYAKPPLRFRGIDDSLAAFHLEGSECCLIHADNPLSTRASAGVWLNPSVRVGYNLRAYTNVKGGRFPGPIATVVGAWANRWQRLKLHVQLASESWTVRARLARWRAETPAGTALRHEPGEPCLINEMQIMWQNGWKHL